MEIQTYITSRSPVAMFTFTFIGRHTCAMHALFFAVWYTAMIQRISFITICRTENRNSKLRCFRVENLKKNLPQQS